MPKNKRESLLFTFIMCFLMVLWMSIYNVARQHGAVTTEVIADAWIGFPPAYIFAMLCDWFVASPLAKGFAFKHLVTPGKSSPRAMTLAVSTCMVFPMVFIMSLYGAFEAAFHTGSRVPRGHRARAAGRRGVADGFFTFFGAAGLLARPRRFLYAAHAR